MGVKGGEEGLRTPNPRLLMKGVAVPGTAPANYISGASGFSMYFLAD